MPRAMLDPAQPYMRHPLKPHDLTERLTPTIGAIVLCHFGVPRLAAESWSLTIDGLVARPIRLTFDDLVARPSVEVVTIHECCGSPLRPEMPTRRICNVRWRGVRLADLIAECGPQPEARFIWSSGADYGVFQGIECDAFVKDLPLARLGADVLIAYEINGEPLPAEHGFPARLVVPGFYGTNSVKWLTRMTLAPERAPGPFTARWYNDPVKDEAGQPTGASKPVWAIAPESVIVSPAPDQTVAPGKPVEIWGWAWGDGGIRAVGVSVNGGASWIPAELEPRAGRDWQRFRLIWEPRSIGEVELCSVAEAPDGGRQPDSGARNAIYRVPIRVG